MFEKNIKISLLFQRMVAMCKRYTWLTVNTVCALAVFIQLAFIFRKTVPKKASNYLGRGSGVIVLTTKFKPCRIS